jgi:hypothetical protein
MRNTKRRRIRRTPAGMWTHPDHCSRQHCGNRYATLHPDRLTVSWKRSNAGAASTIGFSGTTMKTAPLRTIHSAMGADGEYNEETM